MEQNVFQINGRITKNVKTWLRKLRWALDIQEKFTATAFAFLYLLQFLIFYLEL